MNNVKIYKIILILFLTVLLSSSFIVAKGGKGKKQIHKKRPFYIETHLFQKDSTFICYLSYKITLNNLQFVKESNQYSSGYSVNFELYRNKKFVKRIFGNGKVVTSNYSSTNSENLYHEGVISFPICKGEVLIKPSIKLNNTDIEAIIEPVEILVDSTQTYIPIFVRSNKVLCDSAKYELANFQNSLPFSETEYDMLLPIDVNNENKISIAILQQSKIILEKEIVDYEYLNKRITDCGNKIVLKSNSKLPLLKFAKLNFINRKLIEGEFEIELKIGEKARRFTSSVFWSNKPKSLGNIDDAIEYLEIIGLENSVDSLLNFSDDEKYKALFDFWKRFDSDTSTTFNSVFNEFYSRIDIVKNEFNSLGKNDALRTDRGRTYILYGKPSSIERTFNDVYDVIEIWDYKELNEKFYFSDKTGTGKFERIN